MIALIEGKILYKNESSVIIRCDNLGYEVFIAKNKLATLESQQNYLFYIYHHITDSSQVLFGFESFEDRNLFLQLISVSGVGPKTALQFFDIYNSTEIIDLIINENLTAINKVNGIGKKTAERIILELQDKFLKIYGKVTPTKKIGSEKNTPKISYSEREDIISAFLGLGYQRKQLEQLIDEHEQQLADFDKVEKSIKFLLSKL